ncbi:hypothetical protein E4U40_005996 [Claviceps sp. LM458 group G5]|nr:hypothetical protein E4U40_005996 [Claviceps sp. LM458 group G5]
MSYRTTFPSGHVLIMEDPCREDDWVSKNVLVLREALTKPELAHFTKAVFTNCSHTSTGDSRPHVTAFLSTNAQAEKNIYQALHVYHITNRFNSLEYTDHKLFRERTRITKSMKKSAKKLDEESAKESNVN